MLNKCDTNIFISLTQTPSKKEGKKRRKKRKKFFLAIHFMLSATFCTPPKKWQIVSLVINLYTIKRVGSLLRLVWTLTVSLIGMKSKKIENGMDKNFPSWPTILSSSLNWGENRRESYIEKKSIKLSSFFYSFIFNN